MYLLPYDINTSGRTHAVSYVCTQCTHGTYTLGWTHAVFVFFWVLFQVIFDTGSHVIFFSQVIFDTGSFMLAVFADPAPKGMKPILDAEARVFEGGAREWGGVAGELMWRLQGVDRSVLLAANVLFVGLIVGTVTSLANKKRKAAVQYQELADREAAC